MRTFIVLAVTVALASQVAAAQAAGGRSTTFRVSSLRVLSGHPVTLTGRVASHEAGQHVAISRRPYGRSTTTHTAFVVTRGGGYWSYHAKPAIQTTYQARVGSKTSRAVTIGVQPVVSVRELGAGRLSVHVLPGWRFAGRMIKVQQLVAAGAWHTVMQKKLGARSALVFTPSIPSSTIRIAFSVNQAGAGYLGGVSHRLRYHAYSLSLAPSGYRIRFGSPLTLSGTLSSAGPGQTVTIYQQQFKRSSPFRIATVRTGADGRWSYTHQAGRPGQLLRALGQAPESASADRRDAVGRGEAHRERPGQGPCVRSGRIQGPAGQAPARGRERDLADARAEAPRLQV